MLEQKLTAGKNNRILAYKTGSEIRTKICFRSRGFDVLTQFREKGIRRGHYGLHWDLSVAEQ